MDASHRRQNSAVEGRPRCAPETEGNQVRNPFASRSLKKCGIFFKNVRGKKIPLVPLEHGLRRRSDPRDEGESVEISALEIRLIELANRAACARERLSIGMNLEKVRRLCSLCPRFPFSVHGIDGMSRLPFHFELTRLFTLRLDPLFVAQDDLGVGHLFRGGRVLHVQEARRTRGLRGGNIGVGYQRQQQGVRCLTALWRD